MSQFIDDKTSLNKLIVYVNIYFLKISYFKFNMHCLNIYFYFFTKTNYLFIVFKLKKILCLNVKKRKLITKTFVQTFYIKEFCLSFLCTIFFLVSSAFCNNVYILKLIIRQHDYKARVFQLRKTINLKCCFIYCDDNLFLYTIATYIFAKSLMIIFAFHLFKPCIFLYIIYLKVLFALSFF